MFHDFLCILKEFEYFMYHGSFITSNRAFMLTGGISSVIRQKGDSQNVLYQAVRNVRFSENLTCLVFLKHSF